MPVPPRPLPPDLLRPAVDDVPQRLAPCPGDGGVATVHALREAGVSPRRMRASDLTAPGRGLRAQADAPPGRLELLRALQDVGPRELVFSHDTAAWIWGMWVPRSLAGHEPVHVSVPAGAPSRPRRRGVVGHRLAEAADTVRCAGLPVTSPAWTWTDLATRLVPWGRPETVPQRVEERAIEDLIVAGESLLQTPHGASGRREPREHPRCTRAELAEVVTRRRNVRGVRLLRAAVDGLRAGSGSPAESWLRLRLVAAGFPEPVMNASVVLSDGSWLMPDLVWRELRICLEYEGDHHRTDAAQFRADIRRVRRLEAAGWICLRVTADVWTPAGFGALLADLRGALARRGVRI